jgi:eukaryotic-like serine/threonine-protein kinase
VDTYPEGRLRFEREAKLSARLGETSRHIARVTDFGVIGARTPFVVMEFLQGEELSARLKREKQLPLPLAVEIVGQLCRALTVAHEAGVIHRDLKPANVFLCKPEEGEEVFVKLLDFGVAKAALEHEDTQGTRAGTIFGTPGYMSPEQILSDCELDARSDLWSVAVMAYRMTVGKTPFGTGAFSELGLRILSTEPAAPSKVRPDLPKRFDDWMRKGLAKQRDERFASAAELASALAEATALRVSEPAPEEIEDIKEPTSTEEATYQPTYSSEAAPPLEPAPKRRVWPLFAAAIGLAAGAALLAWKFVDRGLASAKFHPEPAASAAAATTGVEPSGVAPLAQPSAPSSSALPSSEANAAAPDVGNPAASSSATPSTTLPSASATVTAPAVRDRTSAGKPAPRRGVAKRADELWKKKDEL